MKADLKALKIIHLSICVGMVLIYTVLLGVSVVAFKIPEIDQTSLIFLLIPIVALFLSNFAFKFHLKKIDRNSTDELKFAKYRLACISRWAIIEGAIIIIILLKPALMIFGMLLILYLAFLGPTEEGMRKDFRSF